MKLKAQSGMLEDILMAVFILIIIVVAVFFIFGFQRGKIRVTRFGDLEDLDFHKRSFAHLHKQLK